MFKAIDSILYAPLTVPNGTYAKIKKSFMDGFYFFVVGIAIPTWTGGRVGGVKCGTGSANEQQQKTLSSNDLLEQV